MSDDLSPAASILRIPTLVEAQAARDDLEALEDVESVNFIWGRLPETHERVADALVVRFDAEEFHRDLCLSDAEREHGLVLRGVVQEDGRLSLFLYFAEVAE